MSVLILQYAKFLTIYMQKETSTRNSSWNIEKGLLQLLQ